VRSGFVAVVGRPNVGKSSLVNKLVGAKVTITSSRPNTTRYRVRGVLTRTDAQVVFVDTPGLHRPRTALGERLNKSATASLDDVDVVIVVVDATAEVGPGDRLVLAHALRARGPEGGAIPLMVVVNKVDRAKPDQVLVRLTRVAGAVDALEPERPGVDYFPISAKTGKGVEALTEAIVGCLQEGPAFFPSDMLTDTPEAQFVSELVREQLLARTRDELPHSIACRVTDWEGDRITCEIVVERDSQKGIVIGKGGEILKAVGTAARAQLPEGTYLELIVRVEKHWQQREEFLDRLGY
jgi:GTP-binding protein Era